MRERPNRMVSKTIVPPGTVGSNPTPSATPLVVAALGAGRVRCVHVRRRGSLIAVALVAVALVAPPAGAGGKGASSNKAIAKAALLLLTDLPGGWVEQPSTAMPISGIKSCRTIEVAVKANEKLRVSSPDFERQPASRAQNSVYAFPTVRKAKEFFRTFTRPGVGNCFRKMVEQAVLDIHPDAQITSRVFDETTFDTGGIGEDVIGIEFVITIPAASGPVATYVTAMAVRVNRFFDGFTFQHTTAALPEAPGLVLASLTRLDAAITADAA